MLFRSIYTLSFPHVLSPSARLKAVEPVRPAPADMMRNGDRPGQRNLRRVVRPTGGARHHGADLVAMKPARLRQLLRIDRDLLREALAQKAHHQARREWPGLAGKVFYATDADVGFLVNLAPHALFKRLSRLHKAGQA